MKLDDFKQHVAKSDILTDREARDLLTLLVGIKPDRELPFTAKKRTGKYTQLGNLDETFTKFEFRTNKVSRHNVNFPEGVSCHVAFGGLEFNCQLEICEVEFCNPADFPINDVQIDRDVSGIVKMLHHADKIEKIPEKLHMGNSVYKAMFTPSVEVKVVREGLCIISIHFKTKSYSGLGTAAKLFGSTSQTVSVDGHDIMALISHIDRDSDIDSDSDKVWYSLLSLKMKLVKTQSTGHFK